MRRWQATAMAGVVAAGIVTVAPHSGWAVTTPVVTVQAATTVPGWATIPAAVNGAVKVQILTNNARVTRTVRLDWRKPGQPWKVGLPLPAVGGAVKVLPPAVGGWQTRLVVPAAGAYPGFTSPVRSVERLPAPGTYVALGDSYAAGEGLGPYRAGTDIATKGATFNMCHRSANDAYATKQVAGRFLVRPAVTGAGRTFWACSGATVATMGILRADLNPTDPEYRNGEPNQLPIVPGHAASPVGAGTRWISLSVGGNDAGFVPVVKACLLAYGSMNGKSAAFRAPGTPSCEGEIATQTQKLPDVQNSLYYAYRRLLDAAPAAKLVVVGYPRVLPDDVSRGTDLHLDAANRTSVGLPASSTKLCVTNPTVTIYGSDVKIGIADVHARALNTFEGQLNAAAIQAARRLAWDGYRGRIAYADTWASSVPHNCSGSTPGVSVNGVMFSQALRGMDDLKALSTASFHPTKLGAQRIATKVEAAFANAWDPGPTPPKPAGAILASGMFHTCRLDTAGKAWCWGSNANHALGDGTTTERATPVPVAGGHRFTALTAAGGTWDPQSCGLDQAGQAWCWGRWAWRTGRDSTGQETWRTVDAPVPTAVGSGHRFTALTAGPNFACGIDNARKAWCWGSNDSRTLGIASPSGETNYGSETPVLVYGGHQFTSLSAGDDHVCGVDTSRRAWCWGQGNWGQLGDGTPTAWHSSDVPVAVTGGHLFTQVHAGYWSTCGIDTAGKGWCWGYPPLGNGTTFSTNYPSEISGGHLFSSIRREPWQFGTSCALDKAGKAWCWGDAAYGQLGDGDTSHHQRLTPTAVVSGRTFTSLAVGAEMVCAIDTGGKTWCWGDGNRGQLGDGDLSNHWTATPQPVTGM